MNHASRRPRVACRFLPLITAVAGLAATPAFAAWDRIDPMDEAVPAHFATRGLSAADDDGYWAFGVVGTRAAVARFRTDGSSRWLRFVESVSQVVGVGAGEAVSAGAAVASSATGCRLSRWSGEGELSWSVVVDPARTCRTLLADGATGAWVTAVDSAGNQTARHVLADGEIHDEGAALNAYLGGRYELVAAPDGSGLYAVGQRPSATQAAGRFDAAVVAVDRHGGLRWQQQVPVGGGQYDSRYEAAAVARNGDLYAVGHAGPPGNLSLLKVASFRRSGEPFIDRFYNTEAPLNLPTVAVATADVGVHVLVGDATRLNRPAAMFNVGLDGNLLHPAVQFDHVLLPSPPRVATTRDGRRLAFTGIDGSDGGSSIYLGDDGAPSRRIGPLAGATTALTLPADGGPVVVNAADSNLLSPASGLLRFDAAGAPLAAPGLEIGRAVPTVIGATFGSDGSAYGVTAAADFGDGAVEKVGSDGRIAWRVALGATSISRVLVQSVNDGRLCSAVAADRGLLLDCRDTATGAALYQRRYDNGFADANLIRLQVLPGGDLLFWYWVSGGGGQHLTRLDGDGNARFDVVATSYPSDLTLGADASAAVLTALESPNHLRLFDSSGGVQIDRVIPDSGFRLAPRVFAAGSNGFVSTWQLANADGRSRSAYASYLDARRGELWSVQLADDLQVVDARFRDDAVVLLATSTDQQATRVVALGRSDGQLRWQRTIETQRPGRRRIEIDPASGDVAVALVRPSQALRVLTLRGSDGGLLADRTESCGAPPCELAALGLDTARHVRLLASGDGPAGARTAIFQLASAFQAPAPLTLDSVAIDGAWYPDYASGQGFVFDRIASAGVLFAPWFTYAPGPIDNPSGVRWFSLQGVLSPGARQADLDLLENDQGRFAEPPITTARKVGAAHVQLDDCNRMTLDYAFDRGVMDAAAGRMTLTRLTAPLAACAGSGAAPSRSSSKAAAAIDPASSGSWYAPALSGQGFMFSFPPGQGLFGAWFTYDPAGSADDATAQHWFTLQGDPATPMTATIYQTLGGGFDRSPTANTRRVGQATVSLQACDRMTVSYQFDGSDVAGRFAGRSGTLALLKIGGCSP